MTLFWLSLCSNASLSTYLACLNGKPHQSPPFQWLSSHYQLLDEDFHNRFWSLSAPFQCTCPSLAHSEGVFHPIRHECTQENQSHPLPQTLWWNQRNLMSVRSFNSRMYSTMVSNISTCTRCGPQKGIEQFASPFMEETGLASTTTSTNATQHDTASLASGVLRTQWSNSWQTPCKYSLWHTYILMDFIA